MTDLIEHHSTLLVLAGVFVTIIIGMGIGYRASTHVDDDDNE